MENQKLKDMLRIVYDSLTDEQKKKANACKNLKELTACLGGMGVALPDEVLDAVAGGGDLFEDIVGMFQFYELVDPPKWPCPKCGSWNVLNHDPGAFRQIRVQCRDCRFFGCRDGSPDTLYLH